MVLYSTQIAKCVLILLLKYVFIRVKTQIALSAEYVINDQLRLNASAGYASVNGGEDEWVYGAAVIDGLNERWKLLFELAGATNSGFYDDILDVRAGFDFAWTDNVHLLFSVATGLQEISEEEKLDYDIFFAVQFFR